jgi:hydroxymethylpyrimidine pyrophosphatase-like HAD family hydrolase
VPTDLYVCDLDGTLLGPNARLSEFAKRGLNSLLAAGVELTVASSRRTVSMRALLAGVELRLPVIELNGAFVSELGSGRHLVANVLAAPVAGAAVEAIAATGSDPVLSAWDGLDDRVYFGPRANEGASWYIDEKRAYGDSSLAACEDLPAVTRREQVAAITGFVLDDEGPALTGRLRELVGEEAIVYSARNYYCPGWTEVQVQHRHAEKGAAIPALLAACEMPGTGVVACGDHLNDLGLFAVAKHRIAPANAHPTILERADEVVASNAEDGVVRCLLDRHGRDGASTNG